MKPLGDTVTLSSALRRLLCDHQISCSVDCCKARAFQLGEGSMSRWLTFERTDRTHEIAAEIERIQVNIRDVEGSLFLSAPGLESEWDISEFRTFWERFAWAYTAAMATYQKGFA